MTSERRPLLVVEDDPALQLQMKWAFDAYEVAVASDFEEAIAQLRRLEPAVVTLDLGLPPATGSVTEGFRTLEKILELAPDTRVIVVTGQNDSANAPTHAARLASARTTSSRSPSTQRRSS